MGANALPNTKPNTKPTQTPADPLKPQQEQQIVDLQTSVAHLEATVEALNGVIASQDRQLQDMQRQLQLLFGYLQRQSDDGIAPFDLLADRPPHY